MVYQKQFVALDLETTHLDFKEGKIMEIGAAEFDLVWNAKKKMVEAKFGKTLSLLVNPEIEPSETALAITGIKKEELTAAPAWPAVRGRVEEFAGKHVIAGHNVQFDLGYLKNQGLRLKNEAFDTLELARTLVPLLESHSLESLAEGFGVLKDAPHRALVDCQNTAEVAAAILNDFLTLPARLQSKVKQILARSSGILGSIIADLPEVQLPAKLIPSILAPEIKPHLADIEFKDQTIYCHPLSFNRLEEILAEFATRKQPAIIALPHRPFLASVRGKIMVNPASALCDKRLELLSAQGKYSETLGRALAKIEIMLATAKSLDLGRLKWSPDEAAVMNSLLVNPRLCLRHDCGYARELDAKIESPVFADLGTVLNLTKHWSKKFNKEHLVLFDLSVIEDKFTDSMIARWNLKKIRNFFSPLYGIEDGQDSIAGNVPDEVESMLNELDLFFGILHLVYLKRIGEFSENLVVDEAERVHDRFQKLFHPASKLKNKLENFSAFLKQGVSFAEEEIQNEMSALKAAVDEAAIFVDNFFLSPSEENISWLEFGPSWVDLNLQKKDLAAEWKNFSKSFSGVTIVDAVLPNASRAYFEKRLGLNEYRVTKCLEEKQSQEIPVRIFFKNLGAADQGRLFASLQGRALLLVPNENQLAEAYRLVSRDPAFAETEILTYKFSGSVAALKKKLRSQSAKKLILILTLHALVKQWKNLPPLDTLVIFRLPFEARGSKSSLLGLDPRGGFIEAILPRAIAQLHRLVSSFLASPGERKNIFILDPRIISDYDQSFMKYFEEFPEFLISTISPEQISQIYAENSR
ncbi:MAG: hypothetical protein A3C85_02395 [Candidatus Doudnabacteria bacterium RIFCSPHIGHO2_02_FULL_48_21]|uniref:Exonuclease domain-containing protein n=1 Tax=Candidatus Doudnabacteria bacterium RIFCSPLOWO2_02_FULL_48_13 TaxID=1817845 RepID=A0A1F5QCI9_9BACT|nr:MAG: hypothetical protein A3K05_01450 [Candidatus Doudnabacteria bacterium RIFCSPHIGHO2_01_48_18]OGE79805.1 MAG: hypothetical protein A2668_02255 [Candidatus Doudnabacteria bacterium RIFCSPHIGHO2_01_FULL_48_180]OGE91520.1 MAG: hypothetical protein A3F44_02380 [Candidatus Doudnabacteria bacterium RIFCSPHIGHO2_12_FULL_47_25]OGE93988.1 MAG: hypothetical protein A3C85_02395 [Candidatus Doudnabacteria bacterium RIFCSPHIGHO2_02_FULL_48_21]OGE98038.1 MAG: hypothetical protein A3A83_02680 [Candidatu